MISVVIPNFNKAEYIAETLDSLLAQDIPDWEALVVDDGSTDASVDIVRRYCSADSRFTMLNTEESRRGGNAARNIGLAYANFDYIVFLDADDLLTPSCLRRRVTLMRHVDVDFGVFPIASFEYEIGDMDSVWIGDKENNHIKAFMQHRLLWTTMSVLWTKAYLERIGGFDERFLRLQDVELHTRALLLDATYQIFGSADIDAYYRTVAGRHAVSATEMCRRYFDSTIIYCQSTLMLYSSSKTNEHLMQEGARWLRGTVFAIILHLVNAKCRGEITKKDAYVLLERFLGDTVIRGIFPGLSQYIPRIFYFIAGWRRPRIRGLSRGFVFLFSS
ncbi:MAG: glycosyltransferase [Pseudomonadales bacterium]